MSADFQTSTLEEGQNYTLECVVKRVAPVKNLLVSWHLGDKVLKNQTFEDSTKSAIDKSSAISLVANRNQAGAAIWCQARLVFGATELTLPFAPPSSPSNLVQIQVLCKF